MNPAQHILISGIRVYRWTVSPLLATLAGPIGRCRFTPSCSQYALDAIRVHGAMKGSLLAVWRICRCNPWGGCGYDPVQEKDGSSPGGKGQGKNEHPVGRFSEGHC